MEKQVIEESRWGRGRIGGGGIRAPYYSRYSKPGHNKRTYKEAIESSNSSTSNVINVDS